MKIKLSLIFAVLAQFVVLAAPPPPVMPIRANPFTTNVPPSRITNQVRLLQTTNAEFSTEVDIGQQLSVGSANGPGPQTNQIGNASDRSNFPGLIVSTNAHNGPINAFPFLAADGVTDDAPLLQALIRSYGDDTEFFLPKGDYLFASPCVITNNRVHIRGGGSWVTKIRVSTTLQNVFEYSRTDGQQIWEGSISGITITGQGNAVTKTAIRIVDLSGFKISDLIILDWYGNNASVCFETQGRELLDVANNCRWVGDIPFFINVNPNTNPYGYLSADHFRIYGLFLSSTNHTTPLVKIADGVHLSSTMFINNSWNGGKYGLYWDDTLSTATSEGLQFINTRKEQNFDTNGYSIYISMKGSQNGGGNLQGLELLGTTLDGACNGLYIRNVTTITMVSSVYPGAHKFLDLVCKPSDTVLSWQNMTFLNGTVAGIPRPLISMYGMREKFRPGKMGNNDPLPPTAFFDALGTTNQVYLPGENWQGTADSPVLLNSAEVDSGVVEAASIVAKGNTNITSGFGPGLAFKAHNATNGPATNGVISAVWNNSTPGSLRAQFDISPMSTNGPTSLLTIRGDGRVLFPGSYIQVNDSGAPINIGTSGGIDFPAGSVWPNLLRNQTHGGLELRTWTGSAYVRSIMINGSDRYIYLGDSSLLYPRLYFWPDNSGPWMGRDSVSSTNFIFTGSGGRWRFENNNMYVTAFDTNGHIFYGSSGSLGYAARFFDSATNTVLAIPNAGPITGRLPWYETVACSDETTAITSGATPKITFRVPAAVTLTSVRASLTTAQTGGSTFTVDVKDSGTTIFSTKITFDNGERTSLDATTQPVLSDTSLADDAEITVLVDQVGDGTAKGLKVTLKGYYAP